MSLWNDESKDELNIEDVNDNEELFTLDDGEYSPDIMGYEFRELVMAQHQKIPEKSTIVTTPACYPAYLLSCRMANKVIVEGLVEWQNTPRAKKDKFAWIVWKHITPMSKLGQGARKKTKTNRFTPDLSVAQQTLKYIKGNQTFQKHAHSIYKSIKNSNINAYQAYQAYAAIYDKTQNAIETFCNCTGDMNMVYTLLRNNPMMVQYINREKMEKCMKLHKNLKEGIMNYNEN